MVNIRSYMSSNFSKTFMTIFLPFFLIISLVYLVKISVLTTQIVLTFGELMTLYTYSIPDIIFYTLPISFVAALANMLMRLSTDNELIAIYALGLKADSVLRSMLLMGLLFSILLLSISFFGMPLTKQFYRSFKEEKKSEAKLNIVPGKLGQKFGEYYIYVKEKHGDNFFKDIVIYNRTDKENEQFFSAGFGRLNKKNKTTSLLLEDGYGYTYTKEKLQQAKYKTLEVYEQIRKNEFKFENILAYWRTAKHDKSRLHRLLFYTFISLIPLLSVYLVASFTMINPRYQRNRSFLITFFIVLLFYLLASILQKWGNFYLLALAILFTATLGRFLFQKQVARFF